MFDELLFVDPVDPAARSALYLREGAMSGANQSLAAKWLAAEQNYDLLSQRGIVRTVDSTVLTIPDAADALVAGGLALDIDVNDSSTALFAGKRRWHMLEARLPASALETRFRPRRGPDSWTGEPVVEVPFAVGASVTLTYALAIAHELCATPFTDNRAQDALLKLRLKSAQMVQQQLPGVYMSSQQPYLRGLVELEVARTIATDAQLRRVSLAEILSYRDSNEPARLELTDLIGQLSLEAQHRPWDSRLDSDLSRISNKAQKIAEGSPWTALRLDGRSELDE